MLAAGLHCWRRHTCTEHRSRWPCVLYSAAGAASDLSSVYVAPGGIYAPSANVYVRPGQTYRPLTRNPATDIGSRLTAWTLPTAHRRRSMATTDRPTPRGRSMSTVRPPIPSVTTLRALYAQERYYAQEYDYEYAPRPPLPVPYRSRRARCDDGYGGWAYCD